MLLRVCLTMSAHTDIVQTHARVVSDGDPLCGSKPDPAEWRGNGSLALVVQWIELRTSKPDIEVRFLARGLNEEKESCSVMPVHDA